MKVRTDVYEITTEERLDLACALDEYGEHTGRLASHAEVKDFLWSHGYEGLTGLSQACATCWERWSEKEES